MSRCIYFDVDNIRMFTFSPVSCDHPISITRICNCHGDMVLCSLLTQKYFMYRINTTKKNISQVTVDVTATFPPWKEYELTIGKEAVKWENGLPIEFNNTIFEHTLRNVIAEFTKEKIQHVKLISVDN